MPSIHTVEVALPEHRLTQDDILRGARTWLEGHPAEHELFARISRSSKIQARYFSMPLESVLSLKGMKERADNFIEHGRQLAHAATVRALQAANIAPGDVDAIVFTSCTSALVPTLDTYVIASAGLRDDVLRVPIYQYGCAGGAAGLALADRLAQTCGNVLLLSTELCSLCFQESDLSGDQLVGSALFADGAACATLRSGESSGLRIVDSEPILIPNSQHIMGYDILDTGVHLRLDRELPGLLAKTVRDRLPKFLERNGLAPESVQWWLLHPGGARILELIEDAFQLTRSQTTWSWNALERYGNLSSASILFVLHDFLEDGVAEPGDNAVVVGVGPGLSIQLLLLRMGARPD